MGLFSTKKKERDIITTRSGYQYYDDNDDYNKNINQRIYYKNFLAYNLDDAFELFAPLLMKKFDKLDKIDMLVQQNEELKQRCSALEEKLTMLELTQNRSR